MVKKGHTLRVHIYLINRVFFKHLVVPMGKMKKYFIKCEFVLLLFMDFFSIIIIIIVLLLLIKTYLSFLLNLLLFCI